MCAVPCDTATMRTLSPGNGPSPQGQPETWEMARKMQRGCYQLADDFDESQKGRLVRLSP
jgi:hypothetical protein